MYSQHEEYSVSNSTTCHFFIYLPYLEDRSSMQRNYSFQSKSPKKKNELSNLYDQLRETNFRLKEGTSRGNSTLIGDVINDSV